MAKKRGERYVGRSIRVPASYFEDIDDVEVDSDFEYATEIVAYQHSRIRNNRRWVFIDHEGQENLIGFQMLTQYLIKDPIDKRESGAEERKGMKGNDI